MHFRFCVFQFNNKARLLASGIETPILYESMKRQLAAAADDTAAATAAISSDDDEGKKRQQQQVVDWPQRLKNHCKYLVTERLYGKDVYEMWLRTSAASYSDVSTFESFLCFAEYVFGDCVRSGSDPASAQTWPGGDDQDPDDNADADPNGDDDSSAIMQDFEQHFQDWYEETHGSSHHDAAENGQAAMVLIAALSGFATLCNLRSNLQDSPLIF